MVKELAVVASKFLLVVAVLGIGFGLVYAQAWVEAESFNRATGKNVSAWDAIWLDLRVTGDADG